MAKKEIALTKIAKISKAQQYMYLSVFGAAIVLGAAISLTMHFIDQIVFNSKVIAAEEESIASYSKLIKDTGICTKPKGDVYSSDELKKCDPETIELSQIPGTLRYNILENLAANEALYSVPKESVPSCLNTTTGKSLTFKELKKAYADATNAEERKAALQNIKTCSALRVIPDALPSFRNEEALLASLNHIFNVSNWVPESLSPAGGNNLEANQDLPAGLNPIDVNLSIEADSGTTMNVLNNIERSIREFNINRATIEWGGQSTLSLKAQATAYYVDESTVTESTKTITPGGK